MSSSYIISLDGSDPSKCVQDDTNSCMSFLNTALYCESTSGKLGVCQNQEGETTLIYDINAQKLVGGVQDYFIIPRDEPSFSQAPPTETTTSVQETALSSSFALLTPEATTPFSEQSVVPKTPEISSAPASIESIQPTNVCGTMTAPVSPPPPKK